MKCFHCHKEWHFKRDFLERKTTNKQTKEKIENAVTATEEASFETIGVLITSNEKPLGQWVPNSDCSFHMCPNRSYFTTYQPCERGFLIGNKR